MTYAEFESSIEGGRPVELHRLVIGGTSYEWTSAEDEITVGPLTYEPIAIKRSSIGQGPEERKAPLELTVDLQNPFVQTHILTVPGQRAAYTLRRMHRDDPDEEVVTLFTGFVQSVAFEDEVTDAKISVLPIVAAVGRPIPRFTFQGLCNHVLYDVRCKVIEASFRHVGSVLSVDGNDIEVFGAGSFPDGWFTGGFVDSADGSDKRMVLAHVGDVLTLMLPFSESPIDSDVVVFAGCDHTVTTCKTKFDNVINYGGFAFIPVKNPFTAGIEK